MVVLAGNPTYASDVNGLVIGTPVKRGRRTTAKTGITTTETGVLRVDDIPVKNGHLYAILVTNANLDVGTAGDVVDARTRLAYSVTTGTPATVAGVGTSTSIASIRVYQGSEPNSTKIPLLCFYPATADGYLSVLLTLIRVAGTGSAQWFCSGVDICDLLILDMGLDPGDTGVVL